MNVHKKIRLMPIVLNVHLGYNCTLGCTNSKKNFFPFGLSRDLVTLNATDM